MRISDWSSDVCSSDLGDNIVIYGYPAELARYKWNRWEFQREHRFVLTALRGPRSTDNPHEYGARYYDLVRDPLWQRQGALSPQIDLRSEERRVGKECGRKGRTRWWPDPSKKKKENKK